MSKKWWVLTSVACGTFMATLDSSIVNIALPSLTKAFKSPLAHVQWIVVIYLLVITCTLLPFGRLSDEVGRRKIFRLGYIIFTLGSLFCGLAPNLELLILSRVIQGVGGAMLMANGPAIITATFPVTERGSALGIMAMVVSLGLISGPSLGGQLLSLLSWRSIFLVNLPIGMMGVYLVQRFIKKDESEPFEKPPAKFDWLGTCLQLGVQICFILTVDPPHVKVPRVLMAVITVVLLTIFIKVESMATDPLLDLSLLKIRNFWTGNLASFLIFVANSAQAVLMPFFLEEVMSFQPMRAGRFLSIIPLTVLFVAPISGRISDRIGSKGLAAAGALISSVAFLSMAGVLAHGLRPEMPESEIMILLFAMGLSFGLFQSPNNSAIMSSVPKRKLGVASAFLATTRNLGFITGTGLATALFVWKQEHGGNIVDALHLSFTVSGFVASLAIIAAFGKTKEEWAR